MRKQVRVQFGEIVEMPFNVNDFSAELSKSGVAQSSHFEVQVTGPGASAIERNIMLRCDTIDIPGRTIASAEYRVYGPLRKIGYGAVYTDVAMSILMSEDFRERAYFEQWQDKIVNTGAFGSGAGGKHNPSYYDEYVGTVTIRQFGTAGDLMSVHTLQEAYPIGIGPVQMSWSNAELVKQQISFGYRDYKVVYNKVSQPGLGAAFGFSFGKDGFGLSASLPGIGNVSLSQGLDIVGSIKTPFGLIRKI